MKRTEAPIMTIVELILDGAAKDEAALCMDWNEVRIRCQLVHSNAEDAGLHNVGAAAALMVLLGPAGSELRPANGHAVSTCRRKSMPSDSHPHRDRAALISYCDPGA